MTVSVENAIQLAQGGQVEQGLKEMQQYLACQPTNSRAWNDAGVMLASQGRYEEAIRHFLQALRQDSFPACVYRNLVLAYLGCGKPQKAAAYFEPLARERLLDFQVVKAIADAFEAQERFADAVNIITRAQKILGVLNAPLDEQICRLRAKRAKIAFFVGGDGAHFLNPILDYVRQRYPVRIFDGQTTQQMAELMDWCDIAWFEWATNLAQIASQMPKRCRMIVRLHRYEAYEQWPAAIQWENVDCLITVGNTNVIKALKVWQPNIGKKTNVLVIPNGVDITKIPYRERQKGKSIAFVGNLRMVKNPLLLLLCAKELLKIDPEYHLFIAGAYQDILMEQLVSHMAKQLDVEKNIHYCGYQKDICQWLDDKSYLVSTSFIESQGMGILEAMAAGIKPIIFHFPGAEEIYPREFLFNTPQEFCQKILQDEYDSKSYREFVALHYDQAAMMRSIDQLLCVYETAANKAEMTQNSPKHLSELPTVFV